MFGTTRAVTSSCENMNKRTDIPTGSRNCICYDPTPNKTGSSLTMVLLENFGRKIVVFPSFFSSFFFFFFFLPWRMFSSPNLVLLKLFSFILVCTFFDQNIFDLVSEEILTEHVLKSLPHKTSCLIPGCSGWHVCMCTLVAYVHHCPQFSMLLGPHCIVISHYKRSLLCFSSFSELLPVWKKPLCASSFVFGFFPCVPERFLHVVCFGLCHVILCGDWLNNSYLM